MSAEGMVGTVGMFQPPLYNLHPAILARRVGNIATIPTIPHGQRAGDINGGSAFALATNPGFRRVQYSPWRRLFPPFRPATRLNICLFSWNVLSTHKCTHRLRREMAKNGRDNRGRRCTICQHEKRHQIELALVHRVPVRTIAARFDVSPDAVHRHGRNHLPPQQRAALLSAQRPSAVDLEALERSEAEGLLSQLVTQRARLQQLSEQSLELADVRAAVAVERAITGNLELVSKLLGMLVQRHEVRRASLLLSPDYLELRQALVRALRPYPEAARAVGAALHEIETRAAQEISESKRPIILEGHAETLQ